MIRKEVIGNIRWSYKSRVFLTKTGYLDKIGKVRKEHRGALTAFINSLVERAFENNPDFEMARIRFEVAERNKQIDKLRKEIEELAAKAREQEVMLR